MSMFVSNPKAMVPLQSNVPADGMVPNQRSGTVLTLLFSFTITYILNLPMYLFTKKKRKKEKQTNILVPVITSEGHN